MQHKNTELMKQIKDYIILYGTDAAGVHGTIST